MDLIGKEIRPEREKITRVFCYVTIPDLFSTLRKDRPNVAKFIIGKGPHDKRTRIHGPVMCFVGAY